MVAEVKPQLHSIEDYLKLELASETRSEYYDGEIIEMTGGTPNHNDIAGNLYILLKTSLKSEPFRIFYADQRLWIPSSKIYTYPDVMVVPKPIEFQTGRNDTLINPVLITEVLSNSTQNYDRGNKFLAYRNIPGFKEYLLINQYRINVEHYLKKSDHQWLMSEYSDISSTIFLESIQYSLQLKDLYDNIDF